MNNNQINEDTRIEINATALLAKYRSKANRILFCIEKNWWHPNEVGFDSAYFFKVCSGEKRYLPNNFGMKHCLKSYRKGAKLSKNYIIAKMNGDNNYQPYLPDNIDLTKLSRDFLLTLVAYINPPLYKSFYETYKEEELKRAYNKWCDYTMTIKTELKNDIENFVPIANESNKKSCVRQFKNKQDNGIFHLREGAINNNRANNNEQRLIEQQRQQIAQLQQINNMNAQKMNEMQSQIESKNDIEMEDAQNKQKLIEEAKGMQEKISQLSIIVNDQTAKLQNAEKIIANQEELEKRMRAEYQRLFQENENIKIAYNNMKVNKKDANANNNLAQTKNSSTQNIRVRIEKK